MKYIYQPPLAKSMKIKFVSYQKVVLLSITIDNFLTFNEHIDNLCRTANYKLHALRRIRKYLSLETFMQRIYK